MSQTAPIDMMHAATIPASDFFFSVCPFPVLWLVQLEGVSEPVVLQVFVGNDGGRVKPHGFYQACRVTGRNTTACQEVDIDGTTVIEVALDPSTNMTLAYVHLRRVTFHEEFCCSCVQETLNWAVSALSFVRCEGLHPKHFVVPAAWTVLASWSCATRTSRLASVSPDPKRKAHVLGWFSASTSLVQMARCSLCRPLHLPSCAVSHSPHAFLLKNDHFFETHISSWSHVNTFYCAFREV